MNEVETLMIYKQYVELMYYENMILKKFPKVERYALVTDIKLKTNEGLECILYCYKSIDRISKLKYLNELDVKLKVLKVFVRISYKNKYINGNNYAAWSKKITNISNLMGGWMKSCRKQ